MYRATPTIHYLKGLGSEKQYFDRIIWAFSMDQTEYANILLYYGIFL